MNQSIKYTPLIKDYNIQERNIFNNKIGIFKSFTKHFQLTYWNEEHTNLFKGIRFFAFGTFPSMKGKVCCHSHNLKAIHKYFQEAFVNKNLLGNIVVSRPTLQYQHFVLDFDLKHCTTCIADQLLNNDQYNTYIKEKRSNCTERYLMNNVINTSSPYNTNYFIYEILYYISVILKIDWLPIYIMGKNGSFDNGFHIEIPDLIMAYHDIALLSYACSRFIPNEKLLDPIINYSIFGSQKIMPTDIDVEHINEFEKSYLPYVLFQNNQFSEQQQQQFSSLGDVFDKFNIIKEASNIYAFKITTDISLKTNNMDLKNLLFNNNNKIHDDTIPEHINNNDNENKNINNISRQIFDLIKSSYESTTTTTTTTKNMYYVGYLEIPSFLNSTTNIKIYKTLLLEKHLDPFSTYSVNKVKLNIKEIPKFYCQTFKAYMDIKCNFSNRNLQFPTVDIYHNENENDNNGIEEINFENFLRPFHIEHLLKLTFGEYENKLRNTIFYLVAIYILSEQIEPLNTFVQKWLYCLGTKGLLDHFLNIYFILKCKISDGLVKLNSEDQNWVILILKQLLIKYNVLSLDEILKQKNNDDKNLMIVYPSFYNNNNNKNIKVSATSSMQIPDIIIYGIVYDQTLLNELLPIYCPLLKNDTKDKRKNIFNTSMDSDNIHNANNSFLYWDENKYEWLIVNINSKNFFLISPELYFIAKSIANNDKNEDETAEDISESNTSLPTNKNETKDKNINRILNQITSTILLFWKDLSIKQLPNYFWKANDCYFLIGGKDNVYNNLIDIFPLPMFYDINENSGVSNNDTSSSSTTTTTTNNNINSTNDSSNSYFNSGDIKHLVNHIVSCKFVQNQLFPIVRKLLHDDKRKRDNSNSSSSSNSKKLRHLVNERDEKTRQITLNQELNKEMKGISNYKNLVSLDTDNVQEEEEEEEEENDIIHNIWGQKLRLINMTRYQYHCETVNKLEQNKYNIELIKMVKYFIIKQMSECYQDMKNAKVSNDILERYIRNEYANKKEEHIRDIAQSLYNVLFSNPLSAQLSDIEPNEITPIQCDCSVTKCFLYLLQTFNYDILGMRYILSLITSAIIYGVDVRKKDLLVLLGDTNSGKTRLLKHIIAVLQSKAGIISSRTSHYGTHQDRTHDIGRKADTARLWYIDEVSNREYNREFFNQLTGNSPLFVRTNYSEGRMIKIAPTVFIFGNNSPNFNENCPALIERLKFYSFMAEFNSNNPICFKYGKFPQLSSFEKIQDHISKGLMAILLHSMCFSHCDSPFYLYKIIADIPQNILDSTVIYSPAISIVRELLRKCNLVEDSLGIISMKRIVYLIKNIPDLLKSIKVSTTTDATRFLDHIYPKSKIANDKLNCDNSYKDMDKQYTLVYLGIMEKNVQENIVEQQQQSAYIKKWFIP